MSKAQSLLKNLQDNVERLAYIQNNIEELEKKENLSEENIGLLNILQRSEFSLCMTNSDIYEHLISELDNEEDFTKKRLTKEAKKLLKVKIIDL